MHSNKNRGGFTVIELLLVLGMIVILAGVSLVNLRGRKGTAELSSSAANIAALLREAQSRSVGQDSSSAWGVHFDNTGSVPFYVLFSGTYNGTQDNSREPQYPLSAGLQYVSSSVPSGQYIEIKFDQISGALSGTSSSSVSIASRSIPSSSSTITVGSGGSISF